MVGQRPKAIVVVSGHHESDVIEITSSPAPPLLFDYYGFPPHTYELTWPAPGSPALAERVQELLGAAGIETATDPGRGYDHGVFVPLAGIAATAGIERLSRALRNHLHLNAGLGLEQRQDVTKQAGILCGCCRSHNDRLLLRKRRRARRESKERERNGSNGKSMSACHGISLHELNNEITTHEGRRLSCRGIP